MSTLSLHCGQVKTAMIKVNITEVLTDHNGNIFPGGNVLHYRIIDIERTKLCCISGSYGAETLHM